MWLVVRGVKHVASFTNLNSPNADFTNISQISIIELYHKFAKFGFLEKSNISQIW